MIFFKIASLPVPIFFAKEEKSSGSGEKVQSSEFRDGSGKKEKVQRRLLMMAGLQLTLSSLLILLLILGWSSPLIISKRIDSRGMPAEQRLGGARSKEIRRSEVKSRTMQAKDLTLGRPQKSIWMMTFDKIKSEVAERIKTTNTVDGKRKNDFKNPVGKIGSKLAPSKASPWIITR